MKNAFLNNIRRGLGSAYIELRDCKNKDKYLKTLIFACLHDCAYDLMTEGPKSYYLYSLIKLYDFDTQKKIRDLIIDSLDIKDSRGLVFQKLDLLMNYYYDGDEQVLNNILSYSNTFMKKTARWDKYRLSAFEIVAIIIDRAFGFKETKKILKFLKDKNLNQDYFGWYFDNLGLRYKSKIVKDFLNDSDNEKPKENNYTLDILLNSEDRFYISCYPFRINENELNKTIEYLKATNNISHVKKILLAFSEENSNYHLPVEVCLNLLVKYNENDEIENLVYDVLEHYKSPIVEKLGLKLIYENKYLIHSLIMIFSNYSKKYKEIVVQTYKKISFSFYEYNPITHETIDFMNHRRSGYPDEILYINYKKSYDSFCREYIFDIMKKRHLLNQAIIEECKYDFENEISSKAKKLN